MLRLAYRYKSKLRPSHNLRLLQRSSKYSTIPQTNSSLVQNRHVVAYGSRFFSTSGPNTSLAALSSAICTGDDIDYWSLQQQQQTQQDVYEMLQYRDAEYEERNASRSLPMGMGMMKPMHGHLQLHRRDIRRRIHLENRKCENNSSKVDETVKTLKNKQKEKVEEIMKEVANGTAGATSLEHPGGVGGVCGGGGGGGGGGGALEHKTSETKVVAPKKSLGTRIWEECVHYYHGFRLLFIDIGVSGRLIWRVLNGKTLTRRENKLLQRTSADIFRLIPFSVFVIVPFLELLLPLFIKLFPNMLPSTFQTAKEREDKLKQALQVKLEMAKFLQKTLDEMPAQHKDHKSEEAKNFELFFQKIKDPHAYVSNDEIIKFAKRFNDEITLDSLSREQLAALCRMLELNTIGTSSLLRFQLGVKLRSLAADDRVIAREGVNSLDLFELQQACKARGMRAYGLTEEKLKAQLKEWIDLSLNEKVPPTLLLLSRTMHSYDDNITTDKLKQILRELPESAAQRTKAAIGECEGKVDNKTKIEIIKQEEKQIQEEREEEREERRDINAQAQAQAEQHQPIAQGRLKSKPVESPCAEISRTDVQLLSDALKTLSDKTMFVEKETIKEIKEELQEYKEDVEELCEVGKVVQEPIKERRGAKLLYKKVNSMIDQLDIVLKDLEKKKEQEIKKSDVIEPGDKERVQIDQLVQTVRKLRENTEESQFKQLESLLSKLDGDKDGLITAEEVAKFIKSLPESCPQIDAKHYAQLADLLNKQAADRRTQELVRIDELMHNIKMLKETSTETRVKHIEKVLEKLDDDKDGVITVNEVLKVVESLGRENVKLTEKQIEELVKLIEKEEIIEAEERIEKALAKSEREKAKNKAASASASTTTISQMAAALASASQDITFQPVKPSTTTQIGDDFSKKPTTKSSAKIDDTLIDPAPILKDKAIDMNKLEEEMEKLKKVVQVGHNVITSEALQKHQDKLLGKNLSLETIQAAATTTATATTASASAGTTGPIASASMSTSKSIASMSSNSSTNSNCRSSNPLTITKSTTTATTTPAPTTTATATTAATMTSSSSTSSSAGSLGGATTTPPAVTAATAAAVAANSNTTTATTATAAATTTKISTTTPPLSNPSAPKLPTDDKRL